MKQTTHALSATPAGKATGWRAAFYPLLGVAALVCAIIASSTLWLNAGTFTYALDDPYIHLALAHNIALGHYGINLVEPSAPSSSIIWPLLLAPFAATPLGDFVPLLLNLFAMIAALALLCILVEPVFGALPQPAQRPATVATVLLICIMINLFGLVFTGMEHTLQIALSLVILLGLLRQHEDGRLRWWLAAALIAAPLVRYECLALSGVALVYLLWQRKIAAALTVGSLLAVLIGGFSLFLMAQGLGPLPSSIIAKSTGASASLLTLIGSRIATILTSTQGWLLLIGAFVLVITGERSLRPLGYCIAAATAAHLLFGRIGGYPRYESYLVALVFISILSIHSRQFVRWAGGLRRPTLVVGGLLLPLLLTPTSILAQLGTPLGSNNVYEQQYQMSRFVAEYWQAPVAVNDLGLVARRGHQYTLDLWGLGSREALTLRQGTTPDAIWMATLANKRGVELVIIYPEPFDSIPPSWIVLGDLYLSRPAATVAGSYVRFYATTAAAAERAAPLLHAFAQQLPVGVSFRLAHGYN